MIGKMNLRLSRLVTMGWENDTVQCPHQEKNNLKDSTGHLRGEKTKLESVARFEEDDNSVVCRG